MQLWHKTSELKQRSLSPSSTPSRLDAEQNHSSTANAHEHSLPIKMVTLKVTGCVCLCACVVHAQRKERVHLLFQYVLLFLLIRCGEPHGFLPLIIHHFLYHAACFTVQVWQLTFKEIPFLLTKVPNYLYIWLDSSRRLSERLTNTFRITLKSSIRDRNNLPSSFLAHPILVIAQQAAAANFRQLGGKKGEQNYWISWSPS